VSEINHRRNGEIVRTAFALLQKHPEGMSAKEVLSGIETTLGLTPFEKSDYPNRPGVRRFDKIARFATIAPVKAGWLVKGKGKWILTEEGKAALNQFKDPEAFYRKAVELYRKWESSQPDISGEEDDTAAASNAATALEEAEELAWTQVENHLRTMNPYDLQSLVAALLSAMGYHVAWVSPPGPDKGIDIVAYTDPIGARIPRIKVQVKRHTEAVNADGLRSFMAQLGDQDVGIYVSTGGFTSNAQQEARMQEKRRVTLIDLERLFDLWVEHYQKVSESDRQLLSLKPVYYLAST
jgi:restriction system protein